MVAPGEYYDDPLLRIMEAPSGRPNLARVLLGGTYGSDLLPPLLVRESAQDKETSPNPPPFEFVKRRVGNPHNEVWVFTTDDTPIKTHIEDIAERIYQTNDALELVHE